MLLIAGNVKDVASVHSTLWPEATATKQILNIGILTGAGRRREGLDKRRNLETECQDSGD